jgi:hypothetical protein
MDCASSLLLWLRRLSNLLLVRPNMIPNYQNLDHSLGHLASNKSVVVFMETFPPRFFFGGGGRTSVWRGQTGESASRHAGGPRNTRLKNLAGGNPRARQRLLPGNHCNSVAGRRVASSPVSKRTESRLRSYREAGSQCGKRDGDVLYNFNTPTPARQLLWLVPPPLKISYPSCSAL